MQGSRLRETRVTALHSKWERALRVLAGTDAGRRMSARFAARLGADAWIARRLDDASAEVTAPTCGALATFAEARRRGIRTVLLHDLPLLRPMHADLDRAALVHPECAFLRRYRAPASIVARQEAEYVLADTICVRGHFAREQLMARGIPATRLRELPSKEGPIPAAAARRGGPDRVLLLAGLATARHGTMELRAALAAQPRWTAVVRAGEGLDPPDLLAHPRIRVATRAELERLDGIDAVVAPSWCESHAPEVLRAARLGVPVVATQRAAGFVHLAAAGVEIAPGDAAGLAAALDMLQRARGLRLTENRGQHGLRVR
ncbi:hypothetical protein LZC95_41345 [Pendulispora brunnea]|uniref:Glycosyltransferase n=1 Tax=Pendulispora brunnea TaxID=2905690 RepID=A0ABZ2K2C7_9BACT